MIQLNRFKLPPLVTALTGITLAAIFILSISFGINFYIALLSVFISIPFYTLIFLNFKKNITRVLVGILIAFTFFSVFTDSNEAIMGMCENWSDYNDLIASEFKLNVSKLFFALGGLVAPMTFLGIVNN